MDAPEPTHDVEPPSHPFDAKFDSTATWSGVQVKEGQPCRRWVIDGEETYEPIALGAVLNRLERGMSGKVESPDHALELVEEYGRKNVFFVTSVNHRDLNTNRRKRGWTDGQFKSYIGRHADFFYLHDRVTDPFAE